MTNDVHYVAEKFIQELIETGMWTDPTGRITQPKPKPILESRLEGLVLLRGQSYFYGHHPRTQEPKWAYDVNLAMVMTEQDAAELICALTTQDRLIKALPAPTFKERIL